MHDILDAIIFLKNHSLHGASVIRACHTRKVVSLMARALPLYGMTPSTQLDRMVRAQGPLHDNKVA